VATELTAGDAAGLDRSGRRPFVVREQPDGNDVAVATGTVADEGRRRILDDVAVRLPVVTDGRGTGATVPRRPAEAECMLARYQGQRVGCRGHMSGARGGP
jgi:hypothetical protein